MHLGVMMGDTVLVRSVFVGRSRCVRGERGGVWRVMEGVGVEAGNGGGVMIVGRALWG